MTKGEGNEIIALYQGWKFDMPGFEKRWYWEGYTTGTLGEISYDTNFNWLIPVVKRVLKELRPLSKKQATKRSDWHMRCWTQANVITEALTRCNIKPLWRETVKAIQIINDESNDKR